MNSKTRQYKSTLLEYDSIEERLSYLRDKYVGKTAVIITPGPSLNDHDLERMREIFKTREDLVILPVKQAYDVCLDTSDFHILNTYNFDKYNGYNYVNLDLIIFYGISKSYMNDQLAKLMIKPHPCDIWVPVVNPPYISYEQCMHFSGDWDKMFMLQNEPQSWWGTSILFEQAIPMALLVGCKKIVTIGWDLTTGEHFFKHGDAPYSIMSGEEQKTADSVKSTTSLYDWCEKNNIEINILSGINSADLRFKRLTSIEQI
jgi:hypothetical protein